MLNQIDFFSLVVLCGLPSFRQGWQDAIGAGRAMGYNEKGLDTSFDTSTYSSLFAFLKSSCSLQIFSPKCLFFTFYIGEVEVLLQDHVN